MATSERVPFAAGRRWLPSRLAYHVLPFVLAGAFVFIAALPTGAAWAGILAFGLADLGCSALLPLTISFGPENCSPFRGCQLRDRLLAGGVRDRRFRRRSAPGGRVYAAPDLRRERGRIGDIGLCCRWPWPVDARPRSAAPATG
jgi:hypothetical protein